MQKLKFVIYLLSALILTGCGQTVVETLQVPHPPNPNGPGKGQTIIVLPFADYTADNSLAGAFRRNLTVTEAITDKLVEHGFGMAIQEDIFGYLVDENIINLAAYDGNNTESLSLELEDEWSDAMKSRLQGYIRSQTMNSNISISNSPGTHALDQKAVAKMGRKFNADYIVRGRLLEFKTRQEATWLPWKKGILPFVNGGSSRILTGFASSDGYDQTNEILNGLLYGAIIGNNSSSFFGQEEEPISTIFGGGIGAVAGKVSYESGRVDQAAVQMRVWVQEAATGQVVWTNRIRVLVSPESIFADNQYDTLFNTAIEKGVSALITDFVSYDL